MRLPLFCTFLLALIVSAAPVSAQETFAPLVTDNTALFVHVDFRKVEINAFKESWTKYTGELIKTLRFDAASQRATLSALARDLEKLDEFIRPTFETITQKLGIRELAVIVEASVDGEPLLIVAVPWKGKTDTDLQTLLLLLPEEMATDLKDGFVMTENFLLFVPVVPEAEVNAEVVETLREWLKNAKPSSDGKIMQAMKTLGDNEIRIALSMTEAFRKNLLEAFVENSDLPEPVMNILTYAARKVEWVAMSLPNFLMAEEKPPIKMTVKTSSAADARQLRAMLDTGINTAIAAWQASMTMMRTYDENMPEIPQTVYALAKGYLRTMLPVIEGDKLVFHQPEIVPLYDAQMQITIPIYLYFGIEMMRQHLANRRTQCENNLFQIGLGIHNYHDVHNAIPPLYTVDADGKPLHSWRVLILPFMEQHGLYDQIRLDEPWDSAHNKQFHNFVIPQYVCPKNTVGGDKNCHYSVIVGSDAPRSGGGFRPTKKAGERGRDTLAYLTDGTSNTLAVVEVKEAFCWMDPTADITLEEFLKGINTDEGRVGSNHKGGAYMLFFDASTFFLPNDTPKDVLRALATPDGGDDGRENVPVPGLSW